MTTQADSISAVLPERSKVEKTLDRGFVWLSRILALSVAGILIFIAIAVGIEALPAMGEFGLNFLVNSAWNPVENDYGALPMIYGTLVSSAIALLFAVPLGIGTAVFLSEDFLPKSARMTLVFMVELLAAIPSVVYGLWGIYVVIPAIRPIANWFHDVFGWIPFFGTSLSGPGLMPAVIVLSIMVFLKILMI